ncbi:MAG: cellulase family glycosylhydrolase [Bacteroidales bacterium]|nr:cellulase family glycosylhydrolase [Bacteroidales bacterium]
MKHLFYTIAVMLCFCACACGEKPEPTPEKAAAPVLVSVEPSSGSTGIATGTQNIVFTYDQNVKCTLDNQKKITISGDGTVDKVSTYSTALTVTVTLPSYETSYTVTVPAGCVEGYKTGQEGAAQASVSFTTGQKPVDPIPDVPTIPEDDGSLPWQMARKLGLGFNLGNQMDAYNGSGVAGETAWGNPVCTQQTFDKLKSYGFSSVRIPITWLGHIGEAPAYTLDEKWLSRVAEIVGYAEKAGLNCIINTHHDECNNDGHWLDVKGAAASKAVKEQITAELKAIWTQIANRFKDKGDFLIFEPFNELQDGGWGWSAAFQANPTAQTDIINEWNQAFVDAVRATGGSNATRWLGVAGYAASSTFTHKYIELPKDSAENRLMVGFHCYDPYNYCLAKGYTQWGHTRTQDRGVSELDETAIIEILWPYYNKFVSKGIPVYVGEFGCVNRTNAKEQQFQKYYLEYFAKASATYGMSAFIWDNGCVNTTGENFGYVNHGTGAYIGQGATLVPAMVKAMTDQNYTLENVYDNAPK